MKHMMQYIFGGVLVGGVCGFLMVTTLAAPEPEPTCHDKAMDLIDCVRQSVMSNPTNFGADEPIRPPMKGTILLEHCHRYDEEPEDPEPEPEPEPDDGDDDDGGDGDGDAPGGHP